MQKRELANVSSLFYIKRPFYALIHRRKPRVKKCHSIRIQNNLCQVIFELLHVKLEHETNTNQENLWHLLKS